MKTTTARHSHILILIVVAATAAFLLPLVNAQEPPHNEGLLLSTYLGGELTDSGAAIAVDHEGYIYITGSTQSTQFPSTPSPQSTNHGVDVFVAKINPSGDSLVYVLWFNATSAYDVDEGFDITVDDTGHAYVAGHTRSPDFCSLFGAVPGYDTSYNGNSDAYLFKVKPDGSGLVYCTFLGGNDWDAASAVIIDENGNASLTGETWSTDFPTTANAYSKQNNGQRDVFVAAIDSSGTNLSYSSYLGGSSQEKGSALVYLDPYKIALTGWTNSTDFPTSANGFDPTFNGAFDAFLAQIDLPSGQLMYGSYLGSTGEDRATGIDRLDNGQILLSGHVLASAEDPNPQFPVTNNAVSKNLSGKSDAFVTLFNAQASALAYSTFLGGSEEEQGLDISAGPEYTFAITGQTTSIDFPTTGQGFQTEYKGGSGAPDAFITQFDQSGGRIRYSSYLGGDLEDESSSFVLAGLEQIYLTGSTRSKNFPVAQSALSPENAGDYDIFVTKLALPPLPFYELKLPIVLGN